MAWKQSARSLGASLERRAAVRRVASGEVLLWTDAGSLEARLLDRSESGFRVAYASGELETGLEVAFAMAGQEGRARVVWNRFTKQHWESGLMIL